MTTLYDLIYDFISTYVFANEEINTITTLVGDTQLTIGNWLSHTATIVILVLLLIAVGYFVKSLFSLFARLFTFK